MWWEYVCNADNIAWWAAQLGGWAPHLMCYR